MRKYIDQKYIIVPEVIAYINIKKIEILLIEWIDIQNSDQKNLGIGLGKMHLKSPESNTKIFGYPINGFIGITDQKKGWESDWIDCFLNLRIIPQLSILQSNFLDKETITKVKKKLN